jgi:hypothetical protein
MNEGGRPPYEPTEADRNTVRSMAACGFSQESIARCLGRNGIDPKTLRLHFRHELTTAMDKANARVGQVAFQKAIDGEAWAVCFWLKCRAGWKEVQVTEHTGAGGGPIQLTRIREEMTAVLSDLPEEVRAALAEKLMLADGDEG